MRKNTIRKIYVKKVFYVARALPRYHVPLLPEGNGKGVGA